MFKQKNQYPTSGEVRKKDDAVVIGYDSNNQPIIFTYQEGDDLVKAYKEVYSGVTDESLDKPLNQTNFSDMRGRPTPRMPDGSPWTLRERIRGRPDIYNSELASQILERNYRKQREHVINNMPPPTHSPWGIRDFGELALVGIRMARKIFGKKQSPHPATNASAVSPDAQPSR